MTLQHLLENAHLDALGLLDERELAEFNAAFAAAPPEVQRHIRREQARWANVDFLLPRVEAPETLRARVLEAVGRAMLENEITQDSDPMAFRPAPRVARHWRTGAVSLLAACVILGAAFVNVRQLNEDMRRNMSNSEVQKNIFALLGGTEMNDTLFSQETRRVHFTPIAQGFEGQASLLLNPGWDIGRFACQKLPARPGESYHVALLDDDGQVSTRLAPLGDGGGKGLTTIDLPGALLRAGTRLAIISIADGASTATILMTATV